LTPTTKIFERIKEFKNSIILIGFKAECNVNNDLLINRAYDLLKSANADLVIANDVCKNGSGFHSETNEVIIIDKNKNSTYEKLAQKRYIGNKILDKIIEIS